MTEKIKIEKAVPKYLSIYADYVNKEKMIPDIRDGLIQSLRRFLLTLHLQAKESYKTTAAMQGYNMLHFHPHAAQDSTPITLVKQKFALGKGQWDDVAIGIPTEENPDKKSGAAAPRYTAIKAHPVIEDMAFKYVRSVPWEEVDLDPEPIAIPTLFPFCLIGQFGMSHMGYGFKTEIPIYEKQDLFDRLDYLLGNTKVKPSIEPKVHGCKINASPKDLEDLLTIGQAKIDVQGDYRVSNVKNTVTVKGWPPGVSWNSILTKINKFGGYGLLEKEEIAFIDESTYDTGTAVKFYVTKQRGVQETFDRMKDAIDAALRSSISYIIYVVDDKTLRVAGVDDMLLKCYNFYTAAFKVHRINLVKNLNQKITESNTILAMRPHLNHCITSKLSVDASVEYIAKQIGHSEENIRIILDKYKVRKLLTVIPDIAGYKQEIATAKTEIQNASSIIKEEYKNVIKQ